MYQPRNDGGEEFEDPSVEKTCPRCAGTGTDRKDPDEDCGYCEGYGTLIY